MITPSFGLTATERVLPNLALDFTTASLDPRVTFTRADNTATVTDSIGYVVPINADLPRFDYNPITLACKGLLIEESRKNLIIQSADFETSWSDVAPSTQTKNVVMSPAGTETGNEITSGAVGWYGVLQQLSITSSANSYSGSCYLKAGTVTSVRLRLRFTGGTTADGSAYFNLSAGTASADGGRTATITPVGNDWYRCTVTGADNNSGNNLGQLYVLSNNQQGNWYAWGAQLELGAFATSYIPTTTTQLTRNADVAVMTGTNFSDWWQATRGGALVRARPGTVSGTRPWVQFDDNTADNIIALRGNTTNPELYIVDGGTPQAQIDAGTIAANTDYSLTGWWQTNDCKARLNNGAVVTDTSATIPTVTQTRLGSDGTNYLNGHLASISYYDTFSGQIYTRRKNKAVFNLM